MEITNQKSFVVRTLSNIAAGIAATAIFWLLAVLGTAVASGICVLILWPFHETLAGMSIDAVRNQVILVLMLPASIYMVSGGDYKEFGIWGVIGKLLILALIVQAVFPGATSWITENCNTFPWFGILMAVGLGLWLLAIYYSSAFSGVVFDYVRIKFGIEGKVFSQFDESVDKNKTIFRLPMLWMVVSFVIIAIYGSINVALDPQLAQRVNEFETQQEERKLAQEFSEQFGSSAAPVYKFEPAPPITGGKVNTSENNEVSNLFTPTPQESKPNGSGLEEEPQ